MRKISPELHKRLQQDRSDNSPPLPAHWFVNVHWNLEADNEASGQGRYSTFTRPVTMNGSFYTGKNRLLDFNEETDQGFVMNSEHLIFGASSGFRVPDCHGLASRTVRAVNKTRYFPSLHFDVWMHYSDDAKEIESLLYGLWMFSGFVTRIELQQDDRGRPIAKVWGGHAGIVASKIQPIAEKAARFLCAQTVGTRKPSRG